MVVRKESRTPRDAEPRTTPSWMDGHSTRCPLPPARCPPQRWPVTSRVPRTMHPLFLSLSIRARHTARLWTTARRSMASAQRQPSVVDRGARSTPPLPCTHPPYAHPSTTSLPAPQASAPPGAPRPRRRLRAPRIRPGWARLSLAGSLLRITPPCTLLAALRSRETLLVLAWPAPSAQPCRVCPRAVFPQSHLGRCSLSSISGGALPVPSRAMVRQSHLGRWPHHLIPRSDLEGFPRDPSGWCSQDPSSPFAACPHCPWAVRFHFFRSKALMQQLSSPHVW